MRASRRRINFGTFHHFAHDDTSSVGIRTAENCLENPAYNQFQYSSSFVRLLIAAQH
jgi:hypothetical protein